MIALWIGMIVICVMSPVLNIVSWDTGLLALSIVVGCGVIADQMAKKSEIKVIANYGDEDWN